MSVFKAHSAPGPYAGFIFQPERALRHLAMSESGATVGIETLDDVSVITADRRVLLEQDKHFLADTSGLSDRSVGLWKSLSTWVQGLDAEEFDPSLTELHLVTNIELKKGILCDLMRSDGGEAAKRSFVEGLRSIGQTPSETIASHVNLVLGHTDHELELLAGLIRISDGSMATYGDKLKRELADRLHWASEHTDFIFDSLLGWVSRTSLQLIREGQPAWLTRESFSEQLRLVSYRARDKSFALQTQAALIPISPDECEQHRDKHFVAQLQWVGIPAEDEQVLEAIENFLRYGTEATGLTQKGVAQPTDFDAFESSLVSQWKSLRRIHHSRETPSQETDQENEGRVLLNHAMNHREPLAGGPLTELCFTQGAFHRLADDPPSVGWHPRYVELSKFHKMKEENNETPA